MPPPIVLEEVFLLPPTAVGRVGDADEPVCAYRWATQDTAHGASKTLVRPDVTLRVLPDGSVAPHLPTEISFRDETGRIRPVAPFFELWAVIRDADSADRREVPVDLPLLRLLGLTTADIAVEAVAANRKAERRTGLASCAFIARVTIPGDDHDPHPLLAISPHTSGQTPLVTEDAPIPLGSIQVLRPVEQTVSEDADPSAVRFRFTPATGESYGPPTATSAPASPLPPGDAAAPVTEYGNIHQIVPPQNRILSADTEWSRYVMLTGAYEDSVPQDGYDGANVGDSISWGVVDDTCDGVLTVRLAWHRTRFEARARFFTGPPDYAPDKRPIYSIAEDLAERDSDAPPSDLDELIDDVVDTFRRAFETASLFNLDAARTRSILENEGKLAGEHPPVPDAPKRDARSFTSEDTPYVDVMPSILPDVGPVTYSGGVGANRLPFTQMIDVVHAALMEQAQLLDFLRRRGDHVLELVRPPFGTTVEWPETPADTSTRGFRDPRVFADKLHDMRMPPYMRDANLYPLSISRRQHNAIRTLIASLAVGGAITDASRSGEEAHHE